MRVNRIWIYTTSRPIATTTRMTMILILEPSMHTNPIQNTNIQIFFQKAHLRLLTTTEIKATLTAEIRHLSKSGIEAHWFRVLKKKYMSLCKKAKGWSGEGRRLGSRIDLSKPPSQQGESWLVTERGQIKNIRGYCLFACLKAAWSTSSKGTHVDIRDVMLCRTSAV